MLTTLLSNLTDRVHYSLRLAVRPLAVAVLTTLALASIPPALDGCNRGPKLPPGCNNIQVPAGNKLNFHVYALGVQIYTWNGSAWVFKAPRAVLYASRNFHGQVGIHYAGPTWESNSGSKVVAARVDGCTPQATAIPWLLLNAVSNSGHGPFARTTFIQRTDTVGGLAPAAPGMFIGQEAEVPYTAEYYFYRAQH